MKKIRTYGFWVALSGAVVVLINALGRAFGFDIEDKLVSDIILAFAGVLVVFGVVIIPKNDEEKEDNNSEEQKIENDRQQEDENENKEDTKKE